MCLKKLQTHHEKTKKMKTHSFISTYSEQLKNHFPYLEGQKKKRDFKQALVVRPR